MRWNTILVILILSLGLFLKLYRYSEYPQRGATSDEYTYTFLGLSLLDSGVPSSWSHFSAYTQRYDLTIDGTYFPMVTPYFDHPPLFGIIVGSWAKLSGEQTFSEVKLATIRLVPIILSTISAILIYLLTRHLYGSSIALLAALIYSSATMFVMHHRVVLAENLLTPLFLGAIYAYERWKKVLTPKRVLALGALVGAAFWTKETGIVVFGTLLVFLFLAKAKLKHLCIFVATFFIFLIGYIVYGQAYDRVLFWKIISLQSLRDIGPQTLWYLLSTPVIVNKAYHDGWYFFGLISLFTLLRDKKHLSITIPFLSYFLLLITTLTKEGQSGWYLIPFFPFMAIASALTLEESIREKSWFFAIFLVSIGLFLVEQLFIPAFGLAPIQFRLLMLIVLFPTIFLFLNKYRAFTLTAWLGVKIFLLLTVVVTLLYRHPI